MEPELVQPTAIDEVLPVIDDVDSITSEALEQLSCNKEEGEDNE